jgi:hypothetical protein
MCASYVAWSFVLIFLAGMLPYMTTELGHCGASPVNQIDAERASSMLRPTVSLCYGQHGFPALAPGPAPLSVRPVLSSVAHADGRVLQTARATRNESGVLACRQRLAL